MSYGAATALGIESPEVQKFCLREISILSLFQVNSILHIKITRLFGGINTKVHSPGTCVLGLPEQDALASHRIQRL